MSMNTNVPAPDQVSPLPNLLDRARNGQMSLIELFQITETLNAGGHRPQAMEFFKNWIAFNDGNPLAHVALFNYSVALSQSGDTAGAIQALRTAIKQNPLFGPGHINLGRALEDAGQAAKAIEQWRQYVQLTADVTPDRLSHKHMSLQHIGRVLEGAAILEEAENALWQAIELQPDRTEAGQHWTALRQRQCKWPALVSSEHVSIRQLIDAMSPLTLANYADDPIFQLAKAYRYYKHLVGRPDLSAVQRKPVRHKTGTGQRLRVGYVSSDLREHAVGFALCEVFELHDSGNVEVFAYYSGENRPADSTQNRIKAAVHTWRDITAMSDVDAARLIVSDEIDVLVDVNGYTKHARTKIFAYRPAPVIVNFCGYPGTMATPFHQYMITDDTIVPPENEIYYTEKVFRIACDQPLDRKRPIAPRPSRKDVGLPEDAFVYACFNGMQKITEKTFARWMEILKATPGSILWLLVGDEDVNQRLRKLAGDAGVEPERLVFAKKTPNPLHLARIGVADLFLDTFPYGAHSTAADAITSGLPVLTMPGKSFASRFCASIVNAAGAPELICSSPEEYVERAIGFARNPESLTKIRQAIADQREASVLRDMPGLAKRLEEIYWDMQGECERGETPVPDLRNLDVYYEVGREILAENVEFEDDTTYRQRYLDKLVKWNEYEPLMRDRRLWTEPKA
ncbi:glycosyl transferase [Ciceribacter sp. L1K23]|uniref:O-linked N-acetylglucosamine transferase, SPINDLY family protein n=1 Tax=Ciceribacter sp. L1K23 TaxID=2820276 RepID=UPI001B83965B|nr:glycosyl transferase [Ciceribacter sp. L1K23]MBR0554841.1 glycosyl transferase [Ciceribacter sp. L1K23]